MRELRDGNGSGSRYLSYRKTKNLKSLGMVILKPEPDFVSMQDCWTSKFVFIDLGTLTSG